MYEQYQKSSCALEDCVSADTSDKACPPAVRELSFFDRFGLDDILLILLLILLFQQEEKDYLAMIAVGYLFFCGL